MDQLEIKKGEIVRNSVKIILFALLNLAFLGYLNADSFYYRDLHLASHYHHYRPQCRTHNKVVKQINGGAPRYIVNGTYTVCGERPIHYVVREPVYYEAVARYSEYYAPRRGHISSGYYYH